MLSMPPSLFSISMPSIPISTPPRRRPGPKVRFVAATEKLGPGLRRGGSNEDDLDLNLLKLFDAIYAEKSVSRAAERVGLTQPSVSHGLARLRTRFRDLLFLRVKGGVEPTATAKRIAPAIAEALRCARQAIDSAIGFAPAVAQRTFRIHMSDLGEMVFLPPLMRAMRERAPQVSIETRQVEWDGLAPALEHGAVDLAIGHLPMLVGGFAHRHLFDEEYVTLRRRGAKGTPDYIAVTSHPPTLAILEETGLVDRVRLSIPHFLVVPAILAEADYAVIVPRTVARAFRRHGLEHASTKLPRRHFGVGLFWTRRHEDEPGHRWMRALMVELFAQALPQRRGARRA